MWYGVLWSRPVPFHYRSSDGSNRIQLGGCVMAMYEHYFVVKAVVEDGVVSSFSMDDEALQARFPEGGVWDVDNEEWASLMIDGLGQVDWEVSVMLCQRLEVK